MIYVAVVLGLFAVFVGAVIWRMEVLRRHASSPLGVCGIVSNKRTAQESGTIGGAPLGGISLRPLAVVPKSFVLTIATEGGERQIVVDEALFSRVEIGDSFPPSPR
ncbi:hypothetical protein P5G50_05470 [Leifsonia sp. F6_8S_P_1B]|uniref:Flagellar protein FliO/FliZ n=1 Tax=Leifsonia williamsii TaxID=3035919 RepID=A0ABT8K8W5_9MICO|nr:hypothetical protein [Leifsonia williamsii]MDN4613898.1 hypothetical protein [Leifsonia williamsii]